MHQYEYKKNLIYLAHKIRDRYINFSMRLEDYFEYLPKNAVHELDEEKTGIEIDIDKLTEEIEWLDELEFKDW